MMGLMKNEGDIKLMYLKGTLEEGSENQHFDPDTSNTIITAGKYFQATFKHSSDNEYFYYFTYNNISDLNTGYTPNSFQTTSDYSQVKSIYITKNNYPHLEFFNDMEIKDLNFLLDNKFLYYKMKDKKDLSNYYGLFDIELNKIIFNTKEKINTFIPHTDGAMLAITNNTAYKICAYKNNNDCTDTCSNSQYLLDISGNTCGSSCPEGKYLFNYVKIKMNQHLIN